ncbi:MULTISPECIES: RluA family pseudouridine synthase [unclassified Vibrio]|uniref:RluA family pseudouridine synthase n=1 Tax=unclassified Vibrio TaxID=2614977 RepID=UPI000B8EB30A|nr:MULTISPECIES: RluA family pseudouridine synthase [unclassified Vibrio]NAX00245.1 RNA pseudouridine synthase [Vibrio sp. V23_P3S9T160]OXX49147.1 RNA pseudouridine synthase [Vibrio sp. V11_P1A41T118]
MPAPAPCFTAFKKPIEGYSLPERFTFPFCYEPHPLSELAASQLQQHLLNQQSWQHNFGLDNHGGLNQHPEAIGKMFGVLVVRKQSGELGYLSAFSGKLAEQNLLPHFVPPIFDMLTNDGFFLEGSVPINQINQQVEQLECDPQRALLQRQWATAHQQAQDELEAHRQLMIQGREQRKQQRILAEQSNDAQQLRETLDCLAKQSVAEKASLKQLKRKWDVNLNELQAQIDAFQEQIDALKEQRKNLSNTLQQRLFSHYRFLNQYGTEKSLGEIFRLTANPVPPAGSGECAAPKLLHYAFQHQMTPISLAEFWWGASPKSEIRQHKKFYPACQNKCQPILAHMLDGLKLDDNPLLHNPAQGKEIDIIYQDEAIVVVNKPAEFLSVPGVNIQDSVYTRLQQMFSSDEGLFVIHRLDMSTSGLLVFALTRRANKSLQKQFITRGVEKRYLALLAGELQQSHGDIRLPLRGDLDDRPRQLVCFEHGKPADTHWQLIECRDGFSKVYLYPKTGRTHQLRVHCAHVEGLNLPIVGDDLYGTKGARLHLHAESLSFDHPYTKQRMTFTVDAEF